MFYDILEIYLFIYLVLLLPILLYLPPPYPSLVFLHVLQFRLDGLDGLAMWAMKNDLFRYYIPDFAFFCCLSLWSFNSPYDTIVF